MKTQTNKTNMKEIELLLPETREGFLSYSNIVKALSFIDDRDFVDDAWYVEVCMRKYTSRNGADFILLNSENDNMYDLITAAYIDGNKKTRVLTEEGVRYYTSPYNIDRVHDCNKNHDRLYR